MSEKSELERHLAFHITAARLPKPIREITFHPTRKWRFDFAWPDFKIACEVEGGVYALGRHTRGAGFIEDCTKYNEAALLGWTVFRVTKQHIETGEAVAWLQRALKARAA